MNADGAIETHVWRTAFPITDSLRQGRSAAGSQPSVDCME